MPCNHGPFPSCLLCSAQAAPEPLPSLDHHSWLLHSPPGLQQKCLFPGEVIFHCQPGAVCFHDAPSLPDHGTGSGLWPCWCDSLTVLSGESPAVRQLLALHLAAHLVLRGIDRGGGRGWPTVGPQPCSLGPCPQVTASQLTVPPTMCTVLLLAESEAERERWLQVLGELQRLLLDTRPRPRPVYTLKEAYDNALPLLPHALCAAIIGEPHAEEHCPGRALGRSLGLLGGSLPSPYSHELRTLRITDVTLPWAWLCGQPEPGGRGLGSCHSISLCLSFCSFSKNLK